MLNIPVAIPLFEMQDRDDDETMRSFVFKTLNARASMPVLTITTDFYSSSVESSQDSRTQDATNVKKTFFCHTIALESTDICRLDQHVLEKGFFYHSGDCADQWLPLPDNQ
jgi:hypothetical protein